MADDTKPETPATPPAPPAHPVSTEAKNVAAAPVTPAPGATVETSRPAAPVGAAPAPGPAAPATPVSPPKPAAKPAAPAAPAAPAKPINPAALKPHAPKPAQSSSLGPTKPAGESAERLQRRRDFTWTGFSLLMLVGLGTFVKIFFPRTLFEPKTRFTIGYPDDYGFGVDIKYQSTQRIWVCRGPQGLYVISAICTHLGCTPDWLAGENQFKCPCHGSVYDAEGRNFAGPAPKPMARCSVELNAEGKIVVDKLKVFEAPDFDKEGAFLPV
jgi:cytochrome b6-f complex iron-sulfur subunit